MTGDTMAKWRRQIRMGIIALASFVLLVTVLPQVASAIGLGSLAGRLASTGGCGGSSGSSGSAGSSSSSCCSGSSGSSGSSSLTCTPGSGNVAGTVAVTGAPARFVPPYLGAGACPDTGPPDQFCADPIYALSYDGTYSLTLSPGTWRLDAFYEINPYGGAFLGPVQIVTVAADQPVTADLTIPYSRPATLSGQVKVTGVPSGVTVQEASVVLCPPGAPYSGTVQSIACVNGYGGFPGTRSGSYRITGLPPVAWVAYPSYCTEFGCATDAQAGQTVTLTPGRRTHLNLTIPFIIPGDGLAAGAVSITGAPAGFSAQLGITACQTQSTGSSCQQAFIFSGGTSSPFDMLLGTGVWQITGYYLAAPFGNPIAGPTQVIDIQGGQTTTVNVAVPYQVLGTAAGSIKVVGLPSGVRPTSYTVTACPATVTAFTYFPSLSCVTEYSGPGGYLYGAANAARLGRAAPKRPRHLQQGGVRINSYNLPTLSPGQWVLTPSYQTGFGTFTAAGGTTVTIAAGRTTATRLSLPYQTPSDGLLTGTVSAVGAPAGGFGSRVRACDAAPTSLCSGELDAQVQPDGTYQLALPPGTWWVSGVVDVYGFGSTGSESVSPPRQVTVAAGSHLVERFTVPVS